MNNIKAEKVQTVAFYRIQSRMFYSYSRTGVNESNYMTEDYFYKTFKEDKFIIIPYKDKEEDVIMILNRDGLDAVHLGKIGTDVAVWIDSLIRSDTSYLVTFLSKESLKEIKSKIKRLPAGDKLLIELSTFGESLNRPRYENGFEIFKKVKKDEVIPEPDWWSAC